MRTNKYKAIKTTVNGIEFDSRKEARRYQDLMLLQRAGAIKKLERQVKFVLIPTQHEITVRYGKKGQRLKDKQKLLEKECSYVADFVYIDVESGKEVVEDTKGVRTDAYKIKRKLMLFKYGIQIKES